MKDIIINILKQRGTMKVIELAIAVWLYQSHKEIPEGWQPNYDELEEIQRYERLLFLLLTQMEIDGIVDVSNWEYVRLKEVYA